MGFLTNWVFWVILAVIVFLMAIIGFLAEGSIFKKKDKTTIGDDSTGSDSTVSSVQAPDAFAPLKSASVPSTPETLDVNSVNTPAAETLDVNPVSAPAAETLDVSPVNTPAAETLNVSPVSAPAAETLDVSPLNTPAAETLNVNPVNTPVAEILNVNSVNTPVAETLNVNPVNTPVAETLNVNSVNTPTAEILNVNSVNTPAAETLNVNPVNMPQAEMLNVSPITDNNLNNEKTENVHQSSEDIFNEVPDTLQEVKIETLDDNLQTSASENNQNEEVNQMPNTPENGTDIWNM